ncbi:AAA family ATPase [Noviluteimonas gilva]|uniref:AAA family ATPase n=1 Tax=Noviluteimonas gilva TaxID=2682097 RepID=A0A7C9LXP2_9GAMM|nr:AAA family ATPase [Lysobacter gilvus]MUV14585.1 AAA family ATPase [Lysobacter gilvus]
MTLEERADQAAAEALARNADSAYFDVARDTKCIVPCARPVVVGAADLLSATFPPRERLLSPWLQSQSLSMIYAPRGIGKTHVALGVGFALASAGEFLGWRASKPVHVLYLDGEMPGADLKDRLAGIIAANGGGEAPDTLKLMTPDLQPDGIMPNLYTPAGQDAITAAAGDARVIIVDNLSCLVRGGKENEGESWQPVAEWALRMRSNGRSVVFIHHAGKGGQQRGTSKREDLLDTVIALKRPADYMPDQGARFEIHFEKARALYGQEVTPFVAALQATSAGAQEWAIRAVSEASEAQMIELAALGLTMREIGSELGVSHSTVIRALNKAKDEGRYSPKAKKGTRSQSMPAKDHGADAYRRASGGE